MLFELYTYLTVKDPNQRMTINKRNENIDKIISCIDLNFLSYVIIIHIFFLFA